MDNNLFKKGGGAVLILFFLVYNVGAFSVATLYGTNYPLKMKAGESKETFFLVRNVGEGDSDVVVNVELVKGSEIAGLIEGEKSYEIASGSESEIPLKIKIPEDAEPGSEYKISALFKPAPKDVERGNIQFIVNIGKSFPVIVIGEKKSESYSLTVEEDEGLVETFAPFTKGKSILWIGAIFFFAGGIVVVLITIIFFAFRRRREVVYAPAPVQYGNYGNQTEA